MWQDTYPELIVPFEITQKIVFLPRMHDDHFIGYWANSEYIEKKFLFNLFSYTELVKYARPKMIFEEITNEYYLRWKYPTTAICPIITYEQMFDMFRVMYRVLISYKLTEGKNTFEYNVSWEGRSVSQGGICDLKSVKHIIAKLLIEHQQESIDKFVNY